MGITLTCYRCERPFTVTPEREGQIVCCPKCGSSATVPGSEPMADYGLAVPLKKCPTCCNDVPVQAVICIRCGYDFKKGRQVTTLPSYKPINLHWNANLALRIPMFVGLLLLCLPAFCGERPLAA